MLLLSCSNLARGFDDTFLFEELSFELFAGQRVGLVGPNGVGKTTLLRLLANLDTPDTGEVGHHAGARVKLLQQQPDYEHGRGLFDEARSALDDLLAAHDDMVKTAEALAQATSDSQRRSLAERYDRLNEMLQHHDAYNVDHRVEQILDGLGFKQQDYGRPINTFSGGQQSRLMLAKLLLSAPDVMLLDEPSNHLDIGATRWLEDYLIKQPEAMIIVSHDRYFLDKVVNKVFELHNSRINMYNGNFQSYWKQRRERFELQLKAWESQKGYIEKQEEYIRRVHYGQLHKQAASRQKQLDKIERVERPTLIESPRMHFGSASRTGDVVLRAERISKAFDKTLFEDLSFSLKRGQRHGIMGPNGSGKTTLLRILLGDESADSGDVEQGHRVQFGYYDQHLKSLADDAEVLHAAWPQPTSSTTEQAMRDLLGRFGIMGDQVHQHVGALSGGERSRVALAKLVAQGINTLVLDEPTNHLDLWACDALEQALLDFEGSCIVVSHDRYFLNRVVDQLIVFETGAKTQVIYGNYDTYEMMRAQQLAAVKTERKQEKEPPKSKVAGAKAKPKRKFPFRKVEDLEKEIAEHETRLQELEQTLADGDLYRDADKVKETTQAFEKTKDKIKQLYEHWEEAVELN